MFTLSTYLYVLYPLHCVTEIENREQEHRNRKLVDNLTLNSYKMNEYEDSLRKMSFSQGQFIPFYIITPLLFLFSIFIFYIAKKDSYYSQRDIYVHSMNMTLDNIYIKSLLLFPFFCFIFGPILFVFYVTLIEDFDKCCVTFSLVHFYSNIF